MNRLKELRESLGLGPDEFAREFGIHRSSLYRYDGTNKKEPRELPMDLAVKIAEKYNRSLDWLAGNEEADEYREQSVNNIIEVYNQLSEENKKALLDYALYLKNKEANK